MQSSPVTAASTKTNRTNTKAATTHSASGGASTKTSPLSKSAGPPTSHTTTVTIARMPPADSSTGRDRGHQVDADVKQVADEWAWPEQLPSPLHGELIEMGLKRECVFMLCMYVVCVYVYVRRKGTHTFSLINVIEKSTYAIKTTYQT